MKTIGKIIQAPLKLIGLIPKAPKPPEPPKQVSRDDAEERAGIRAEIDKRRGGQADIVTGSGGIEAGTGGATRLG